VLSERDFLHAGPADRDADLRTRLELLGRDGAAGGTARGAVARVRRAADFFARQLRLPNAVERPDPTAAGELLAAAYPDRIARSREPGSGRYQLAGGRAAVFTGPQSLARAEFLVIPEIDAGDRDARIRLAAPLTLSDIDAVLGHLVSVRESVGWDEREQAVVARRQRVLGGLVLEDLRGNRPDPEAVRTALLAGLRGLGLAALPWTDAARDWQARASFVRAHDGHPATPWPDVGDEALLATLEDWLAPFLDGMSRRDHLARLDLLASLRAMLSWEQQRRLDELAPTHLEVPSGSRIPIDYREGPGPSLSVRLQEVFGLRETPRLCGGRVPVMMKLLSPAGRPVQVTQDLESFWARGYHDVRRELKGRYPKHSWPDDPWTAQPTRRARPRP
jgi:ATP-dependent helicase HrpB